MDLENTVFHKIISGELPSYKLYEDDDFVVILDRFPAAAGHTLILPKIPAKDIFSLSDESAARLYPLAKRVATAVKAATGCDGINIIQNNGAASGQAVFYFHLHILPRFEGDDIRIKTTQHDPPTEELAQIQNKIKASL